VLTVLQWQPDIITMHRALRQISVELFKHNPDILWAGHIEWKNFSTAGKVFMSHVLHNRHCTSYWSHNDRSWGRGNMGQAVYFSLHVGQMGRHVTTKAVTGHL